MLSDLAGVATQMQSRVNELARWIERRQADLPDEEERLRAWARELKNDVRLEHGRVRDRYDKLYESGAPTAELHEEIDKAGREMREWLAGGLGAGSTQEWLRRFNNAVAAADMGRELDYWYNSARKQVVEVFGGIDAALGRSVDRLWGEVADTLRVELSDALVVPDPITGPLCWRSLTRRGGAWPGRWARRPTGCSICPPTTAALSCGLAGR